MHHDDAYTSAGDDTTHARKLAEIETLVRRHNNPGVNVGAHRLAGQVLAIIEGRPRCGECGAAIKGWGPICDCAATLPPINCKANYESPRP